MNTIRLKIGGIVWNFSLWLGDFSIRTMRYGYQLMWHKQVPEISGAPNPQ